MSDTQMTTLTDKLNITNAKKCIMASLACWTQFSEYDWSHYTLSVNSDPDAEIDDGNLKNVFTLKYQLGDSLTFFIEIDMHYHRLCFDKIMISFFDEQVGVSLYERDLHNILELQNIKESDLNDMLSEAQKCIHFNDERVDYSEWRTYRVLKNIKAITSEFQRLLGYTVKTNDPRIQMAKYIHAIESSSCRSTNELISEDNGLSDIEQAVISDLTNTIICHKPKEQVDVLEDILQRRVIEDNNINNIIIRALSNAAILQRRHHADLLSGFAKAFVEPSEYWPTFFLEQLIHFADQAILTAHNSDLRLKSLEVILKIMREQYCLIEGELPQPEMVYDFDSSLLYRTSLHSKNWESIDFLCKKDIPYIKTIDKLNLTNDEAIELRDRTETVAKIIKQCQRVADLPSSAIFAAGGIKKLQKHFGENDERAFGLLVKWSVECEDIDPVDLVSHCTPWNQSVLINHLSTI